MTYRDIPGYVGFYRINDFGDVIRPPRLIKRRGLRPHMCKMIHMKPRMVGHYMAVGLTLPNGKPKNKLIHRLVAMAFIENPENKPCVNHKDGDKMNNHVSNLEWCTRSENDIHAYRTGLRTQKRGEKHHQAKLKDEDVRHIRKVYKKGEITHLELANKYGVSRKLVSMILSNKKRIYT